MGSECGCLQDLPCRQPQPRTGRHPGVEDETLEMTEAAPPSRGSVFTFARRRCYGDAGLGSEGA